jgi:hypothetical protein
VDDPAQKCTARSSTNDSKGKKVVVPSEATITKVNLSNYDEDGYPEAPHFTLVLLYKLDKETEASPKNVLLNGRNPVHLDAFWIHIHSTCRERHPQIVLSSCTIGDITNVDGS